MALLAVDAGRSEVEIKCETGVRAFPSAVSVAKTRNNPEYYLNSLEIHIDGEKWWLFEEELELYIKDGQH